MYQVVLSIFFLAIYLALEAVASYFSVTDAVAAELVKLGLAVKQ